MLAFEQPNRQHIFDQAFAYESDSQVNFASIEMDQFNTFDSMTGYNTLPYSYFENPSMFVSAPAGSIKQEMSRTVSNNSLHQYPLQQHEIPPALISTHSIPSASSSTVGSPYSGSAHTIPSHDGYGDGPSHGLGLYPTIVSNEGYINEFVSANFDNELSIGHDKLSTAFVDPALISGSRSFAEASLHTYPDQALFSQPFPNYPAASPGASPVPSHNQYIGVNRTQFSPPMTNDNYIQQQHFSSRRPSISSYVSGGGSHASPSSDFNEDGERGRCPHPDCGKVFKDLKAHMLTHQAERPEKCPILTCDYYLKGFARKYDKNRHTLTHYKGTMVCGFCPGSGSAAEKSFNRADVFKRHLTSVHGVEQTPPNSRKRSPTASTRKLSSYCQDATGKCSTCSATFSNAQDFYEHLDDCVLRVVQQEEPSEAINAQHLSSIEKDEKVLETFDRHMIKTEDTNSTFEDEEEDEDTEEDDEEKDDDPSSAGRSGKGVIKAARSSAASRVVLAGGISKPKSGKKGMTWSKGGVPLVGKGRKKRKHYPPSWGMSAEKMQMKKRVLCVYDGERRLWKDDMMLHNEFEVRMKLPDGNSYVTDLDVETLKRAEAFHNATPVERGPWVPTDEVMQGFDLNELMSFRDC